MKHSHKDQFTIECRRAELGLSPALHIGSLSELATLHYVLSKRQPDGEKLQPQDAYIKSCKDAYFKDRNDWLPDMFIEMKKELQNRHSEEVTKNTFTDKDAVNLYLKYAQKLDSPFLSGKMQAPYR